MRQSWILSFMISIKDHVSFIYDLFEDINVEIKNLVRKLLRKRTLILVKALP